MRLGLVEPPLRPRWLRFALILGVGLLLAVMVWWPMLRSYPQTPIEDGHYFYTQIEISKQTIKRYHELPLFNPFDCRGIPMWDHPENITASPIFYLTLPFSSGITIIVWNLAHVVVGFLGMWLLCRDDLKLSRIATFVAAVAWAYGTVHNQYAGEHEAFVSFYHAPLLLFAWRRAEESWNWVVGTGLLLAWMVYDGATYPLPLTVVFLGIETVTRFTDPRRALRIVVRGLVVGLVSFSIGASRILPIQDQFASHNRVMEDDFDHLSLKTLADMYLLRSPHWRAHIPGQQYVLGEYHAYIGICGVLLLFLGILVAGAETWWLLAVSLVLFVLMLGHFATWSPWTVLHASVPPFKSMRVPARFRLLLALPIAAYMAYAVDRVPMQVRRWLGKPSLAHAFRVALAGIGIFAAGDSAGLFTEILEYRFMDAPPALTLPQSTRFYYGGSDLSGDFGNHPRQNHAWLNCRAAWAYNADAAVWTGDVPQARAVDDGAVVEVANRTHNKFWIDVDVKRPARIHVNSAYERGWQTNIGTVVDDNHLLAVDLPPGHHRVEMRYWPRRMNLGLAISALGLLGSIGFLLRKRLRALRG